MDQECDAEGQKHPERDDQPGIDEVVHQGTDKNGVVDGFGEVLSSDEVDGHATELVVGHHEASQNQERPNVECQEQDHGGDHKGQGQA